MRAAATYGQAIRAFEPMEGKQPMRKFASFGTVLQGWYPVGRADLSPGEVRRVWIGARDLVLYRDLDGTLRVTERACGHLGADLAKGRVVAQGLECAFHRWCWGADGACSAGGGRGASSRIRTYAVEERWGLAWVWAGDAPAYPLPQPGPENRHVLRLPEQRLACHPHVMLGNGLDVAHVGPVHRFHHQEEARVELAPPHRVTAHIHARFGRTLLRSLLGLSGRDVRFSFTTIGPSLAWLKVEHPTPFELVWAGRPLPDGGCAAQTVFFLPRRRSIARALPMMVATTWADRKVLDRLEFRPNFVASDAIFALYARQVEAMPAW